MTSPIRLVPAATEKQIQADVKRALALLGFDTWDTSQPFRAAITPGLSDLIVMGKGVVGFVECKSATGRLTHEQQQFKACVEGNGGHYLVAKSAEDIVHWVEGLRGRSGHGGEK